MFGIDDGKVCAIADSEMAGIEPVPVREFAGEAVDRLLDRDERRARPIRVADVFEESQTHVVERHVPEVRACVREAHLHPGFSSELLENFGPVVRNGGVPTDVRTVLENEVEECVDGMQPAAFRADVPEGLPDDGGVWAVGDDGVEEVSVPRLDAELLVVVLAEPAAVGLVAHEVVTLDAVLEVEGLLTGSELLEDHEVD